MNLTSLRLALTSKLAISLLVVGWGCAPLASFAQSGRIEQGQITSDALANNLFGDSTNRPFRVYLPPSYDTSSNRYPVIYVLHGYLQNESALITPSQFVVSAMQPALDSMIAQRTIGETIAVFVNGANRVNGSFYLSSPVIGDYETYITRDLVNLIDRRYRTLNSRESRGLLGFSMGGWGAMHLALKFPTVFSVVAAESGLYDSRSTWADGLTRSLMQMNPTNLTQFASVPFPTSAMQALFAGLLPNPQRPSLFADYPYERVNNQFLLVDAAHLRCLMGDVQHGDLERYLEQPVRLGGIKLVHGTADTIIPISETRQFTNALGAAGISFAYEEHSGNHVFRADLALPFLSSHLTGAERYITPPRISQSRLPSALQMRFPTQTGVTYEIRASNEIESPFGTWPEKARVNGNGQPATVSVPTTAEREFFRIRATNN